MRSQLTGPSAIISLPLSESTASPAGPEVIAGKRLTMTTPAVHLATLQGLPMHADIAPGIAVALSVPLSALQASTAAKGGLK